MVSMIKFIYIGLPAVIGVIGYIIMRFYTLDEKLPQIEKELAEREAEESVKD